MIEDSKVARFLKTLSVRKDKELLSANALSIVATLGEIESVITLCLTHPDSDETYCKQAMSTLKAVVGSQTHPDSPDADSLSNASKLVQLAVHIPSMSRSVSSIQTPNAVANYNSLRSSESVIVATNPSQFYRSSVVFCVNTYNNLYFKLFSNDTANWMMELILFNKQYYVASIVLIGLLGVISEVIRVVTKNVAVYLILRLILCIYSTCFAIAHLFSINFDILSVLVNSFDFWFKTWNLFIWQICFFLD